MPDAPDPVAALLGQSLPPTTYEVSRAKIREFAAAIGETSPLCRDVAAATAVGYRDLVAPPTFAVIAVFQGLDALVAAAGIDYSNVVHGDQRFEHRRPIHADDVLATIATVDRVRAMSGSTIVTLRCTVSGQNGDQVCTATSTVIVRGATAEENT